MTRLRRNWKHLIQVMRSMRHLKYASAMRNIFAVVLTISAHHAWGVQCNVSAQGVNFGSYDTFSNTSLDSTGNIAVICDAGISYAIALSPGSGAYASRSMADGSHVLHYNLYTDATRSAIWGDGSGGTSVVHGSGPAAEHTVYGRIYSRQNVYMGNYSDSITVTVNF